MNITEMSIQMERQSSSLHGRQKHERDMETVMLGDRIRNRAKEKEMVIFDSITHWNEEARSENIPRHLSKAYEMGKKF